MAAVIAPVAQATAATSYQKIIDSSNAALENAFEQFAHGVEKPTIPYEAVDQLGHNGLIVWKNRLEHMVQGMVQTPLSLGFNSAMDTLIVTPMASEKSSASQSSPSSTAGSPPNAKVPRPPNEWIIYRQEWHSTTVAKHPDVHNTEISKIIARQWKAEPQAVKDEYKRKAEDAKRQHAIDHPGYQYQPRKPSEKKKRMTKTKLAKLRAQGGPMKDLNETLVKTANDKRVTVGTFQTPHRQGFPNLQPSQQFNNCLTFDANGDFESLLYNQLVDWNADNPGLAGGQFQESAALVGLPLADGQKTINVPQHEVPDSFTQVNDTYDITVPDTAISASATCFHDATAEVERQGRIGGIDEFFNFEAYDAESALQDFQSNHVLDFE